MDTRKYKNYNLFEALDVETCRECFEELDTEGEATTGSQTSVELYVCRREDISDAVSETSREDSDTGSEVEIDLSFKNASITQRYTSDYAAVAISITAPFACPFCRCQFTSSSQVRSHIIRYFKCPVTGDPEYRIPIFNYDPKNSQLPKLIIDLYPGREYALTAWNRLLPVRNWPNTDVSGEALLNPFFDFFDEIFFFGILSKHVNLCFCKGKSPLGADGAVKADESKNTFEIILWELPAI